MINRIHKFIFVHAGKCGGSTIEELLKTNNIKHEIIHCRTCNFNKNKKYLKKDYEVIDYFYDIGSLNKDKYNLLSI